MNAIMAQLHRIRFAVIVARVTIPIARGWEAGSEVGTSVGYSELAGERLIRIALLRNVLSEGILSGTVLSCLSSKGNEFWYHTSM